MWGSRFRARSLEFRPWGSGFRANLLSPDVGLKVSGSEFRPGVSGSVQKKPRPAGFANSGCFALGSLGRGARLPGLSRRSTGHSFANAGCVSKKPGMTIMSTKLSTRKSTIMSTILSTRKHNHEHNHEHNLEHQKKHNHEHNLEHQKKHIHEHKTEHQKKHNHERKLGHQKKHKG